MIVRNKRDFCKLSEWAARGPSRRITLGALVSAICAFALMEPGAAQWAPAPAQELLYQQRFAELMREKGVVSQYAPLEQVPGAPFIPLPPARTPTIRAEVLAAATTYVAANNSSAFIVWRRGKIEVEHYFGTTRREQPILSKSLAKPLGAIAIGRAIALGKVKSLDEPAVDLFPEWRGTPKAAILVRHLLDMRSGMLEQSISTDSESPLNRAYIDPDHGAYILDRYPLTAAPGTSYAYANAPSELIAVLIERATGQRYADFIGNEVLRPIDATGGSIWIDRPGGLAHSGAGIFLPAQSWLRLAILLLDDGMIGRRRLLPHGYVAEMRRGTPQNHHFGLGLWVAGPYVERRNFGGPAKQGGTYHSQPYLDRDLFLFDGNADQVVYVSPQTRTIILRTGDNPPKSPEWDNARLPNLVIAGIKRSRGERPPVAQAR